MEVVIRQLLPADLPPLASQVAPTVLAHHEERLAWQQAGRCRYLVAWQGDVVVGRATVLWESKYSEVRRRVPACCEVNALEAKPTGQGVGRALLAAAHDVARSRGALGLGVAVEPSNLDARRFYGRLGYRDWGGGQVCDEWNEHDDGGELVRHHADSCDYLVLTL